MGPTPETHSLNARLLRFRSHPEQEDARALAADLLQAKRYGDARGVTLAAQEEGADGSLLVIEGRAWYEERDLVRAQAALLKAAKVDPRAADAFRWLGEVLLKRGDPGRAVRALNRALDLRPDYVEAQDLARRAEQLARVAASVPVEPAAPEPEPEPTPEAAPTVLSGSPAVAAPPPPAAAAAPVAPPPAVAAPPPAPSARPRPVKPVTAPAAAGQPSPFPPPAAPAVAHTPSPAPEAPTVALRPEGEDEPTQTFRTSSGGVVAAPAPEQAPFEDLSEGGLDERWEPSEAGSLRAPTSAGTTAAAGRLSSPGMTSAAGGLSSPGTRSAAGGLSSPGTTSAAAGPSSPGTRSAVGGLSSPGTRSAAGGLSSPGTRSAAGGLSSPGTRSAAGGLSSPGTRSAAGGLSSPGSSTAPGLNSSPGHLSTAGYLSAPGIDAPVDVEVDLAAEPGDTTPGMGDAPPDGPGWDESSPALDFGLAHTELAQEAFPDAPHEGLTSERPPDESLGDEAGHADDPERVLESLRVQGIYEPDADDALAGGESAEPAVWAAPQEVVRSGTRLRGALIGVWAVTMALFAGGYYGWHEWVGKRHADAQALVVQARAAAFDSDYARLVDAERLLRQAREKHARSTEVPRYELFVHAQRVLENGSRELSALRTAIKRGERLGADARYLDAARAVLAAYSGGGEESARLREAAVKAAAGDGELLYVVGRLEQRLGLPGAAAHLEAATKAVPDLRAATIALGEQAHDAGARAEALARFDSVLKQQSTHLRAGLWRSFLTADEQEPAAALTTLDALTEKVKAGAPIDRVLWSLTRARLLTRQGELETAGKAVTDALSTGADEPRLLAMVAEEARRTGQMSMAQHAATRAVAAAPGSLAYRVLLARVMIERGDGARAVELLDKLPADDPTVLMMRARAALQSGEPSALEAGLEALQSYPDDGDAAVAVQALELRLKVRLSASAALLRKAKRLARRAPGDPDAARALGEVALELEEPREASKALEQLVASVPDDAEGHYLLARARRMGGDGGGAIAAYQKALELAPSHRDALVGLGGLLLDSGKYAEADGVYQRLVAGGTGTLFGRLGRVEALIGLGKLDDAKVQLAGIPEKMRDGRAARETGARLALARRKPGQALTLLRPLAQAESVRPATLALYGDALYAADQVNASAQAYERALEADSTLPEALIGRAQVHLRAERPGDALELLDDAQDALKTRLRGPDVHARMLTYLGHAYVQREKRGDLERARKALLKALELPGAPVEANFWLGEASGGRRTPEAAAAFKAYLAAEPNGHYAERAKRALGPML